MPRESKRCRVCGRRYEACRTTSPSNVFRWRDVACSPECGAEYFRRVQLSRETESPKRHNRPIYNEDVNGFYGTLEEEYINGFGSDE